MGFMEREVLPGVWHIRDGLGVCFTLLTGASRALLVDAGYGIEDVSAFIHTLTDLPVTLWLTHGHFDHAPGARWFEDVRLCPAELPVYERYAGADGLRRLADMAAEAGLSVEQPDRLPPKPRSVPGETLCLGGLTARVIPCPGHTPGSAAVFVPERRLLLTGDDWNPCTWLFFPEALPVETWRENLRRLMDLPFEWVLCPHREKLYPRKALETFLDAATDAALDAAVPSDAGTPYGIDAVEVHLPGEGLLVFDPRKRGQGVNSTAIR